MANLDPAAPAGNGKDRGHVRDVHHDKHDRVARTSLAHIIRFHETLDKEMRLMLEAERGGQSLDSELFDRMALVQDKYYHTMSGFREMDDIALRHALISFADAMQDLMKLIHKRGEH